MMVKRRVVKKVVIYTSTITGNARKLTLLCQSFLLSKDILVTHRFSKDLKGVIPQADLDADLYILGFWCRRGALDDLTANLVKELAGKSMVLMGTMGADPQREYGKKVPVRVCDYVSQYTGDFKVFVCQGKIDEKRTDKRRSLPKDSPHYLDDEAYKRHLLSRSHPDEADLSRALAFCQMVYEYFLDN